MHFSAIKNNDIANGLGIRVSLFVSGCRNHCPGCFQPETWDFRYGKPFDPGVESQVLEMLKPAYISGLTILGGEPMEQENQRGLLPFLKRVRQTYPNKDIWLYSGFTWEMLTGKEPARCQCSVTGEVLGLLDILVDGRFDESKKDMRLRFRGSSNQRIIQVPETLRTGNVICLDL